MDAREILAKTLMAEAGGEGLLGMLAAGAVIDNRRRSDRWGSSFEEVIMQPAQFSAWNGVTGYAGGKGGLDMANMRPSADAYKAADQILSGDYTDPTNGATHYYNPAAANPVWGGKGDGWQTIGNHRFGAPDGGRMTPRTGGAVMASASASEPSDFIRRAEMASAPASPPRTDWLRMSNQGATRNDPLSDRLIGALSFLGDMGVQMEVFSGGQEAAGEGGSRTGSTRHDHGHAADVFFYKDGRKLDWANAEDRPIFEEIVRRARGRGITGIGAGENYMRPGSMHIGFGTEAVWGAGGKGANAPDWLRRAYGSPIMDDSPRMASGGGSTEYLAGGSGSDRLDTSSTGAPMAPSGGILAQFAREPEKVGGLLGMLFPGMSPDRADSIRAGLAGLQGIDNPGVMNAARQRMGARADAQESDRRFAQQMALKEAGASQAASAAAAAQEEEGRRREAAARLAESAGNQRLADAVRQGLVSPGDVYAETVPKTAEATAAQRNYEFMIQNGVSPEDALQRAFSGGVTINNGNPNEMPGLSNLGEGMTYLYDEGGRVRLDENGAPIAVPIPGTDREQERIAAQEAEAAAGEQQERYGNVVVEDIGRVRDMLQGGRAQPITGLSGRAAGMVPGSEASDVRALMDTITANIGFDRLQQMRDASPTGGALGSVTERELKLLQSVMGSLDLSQSREQLLGNLDRLERLYTDIIEKAAATGDGTFVPRQPAGGIAPATSAAPAGEIDFDSNTPPAHLSDEDKEMWPYGSPEERRAIWGNG